MHKYLDYSRVRVLIGKNAVYLSLNRAPLSTGDFKAGN